MAENEEVLEGEIVDDEPEGIVTQLGYPEQRAVMPLQCSDCGSAFFYANDENTQVPAPNYCPECGATFLDDEGNIRFDEDSWKQK